MAYNFLGNNYIETTTQNPIEYYWEQINKSLDTMTKRPETKQKHINNFKASIANNAKRLGVDVKDKQMYADYCFKACQAILFEMIFPKGMASSTGYAWEYFICGKNIFELGDKQKTINMDMESFYNKLLDNIEDTLKSEVNASLLGNKKGSFYTVLNIDKLRNDLSQKINTYYSKHPEKTTSTESNPALQKIVNNVFSNISDEFTYKISNSKYSSTGWTF